MLPYPVAGMTPEDRRFALQMIPYGVYVVTALDKAGEIAAATVHWVMQTSFEPPLIAVAMPADGRLYGAVRATEKFALHMLGRGDAAQALTFQDGPAVVEDGRLSGWPLARVGGGLPLLRDAVAVVECAIMVVFEFGDHHTVIGEVVEAHVRLPPLDRPDRMILRMQDLGETIFYGG